MRRPVVVDTGDAVYALLRSTGTRSRLGLFLVWLGEKVVLASAAHIIVRGRSHASLLPRGAVTFAPDLAPAQAVPMRPSALKAELDFEEMFVVGLVGSLHFAPRLGITYGWDLIAALALTPTSVGALIVGDGDGKAWLERRALELEVADRCRFVGSVPPAEVSVFVAAMDAAVSTQTADRVGEVRTTGKLPLYLACGCPVLASHVGEAARLVGPLGWTIPYDGVVDQSYPARLAEMMCRWATDGANDLRRQQALRVHAEAFDATAVRSRVRKAVEMAEAGAG